MKTPSSQDFLNKFASKHIGDGKRPNLYFVTDDYVGTIAIFNSQGPAVDFARSLSGPAIVEDRLNGQVWTNDAYEALPFRD